MMRPVFLSATQEELVPPVSQQPSQFLESPRLERLESIYSHYTFSFYTFAQKDDEVRPMACKPCFEVCAGQVDKKITIKLNSTG